MPSRPSDSINPLRILLGLDVVCVGAVIGLHCLLGPQVSVAIHVVELLVVAGAAAGFAYLWWRTTSRDAARTPAKSEAPSAEIEALRRETAENLRVLQDELNSLGQAIMKRLSHKAEARPESEHFEALAGTVTDLAVSLAEAREMISSISVSVEEAKSAVFELQAQADQQSDALRAFEHSVEHARVPSEAGDGPAPGSLERALAAGVAGAAVSRLIGNAAPRETVGAGEPAEAEAPEALPPLSSDDLEGAFESDDNVTGDDFEGESLPDEDWGEAALEDAAPVLSPDAAAAPAPESSEASVTEGEESEDWLSAGLDEESPEDAVAPESSRVASPSQPELPVLSDEGESKRKPRRPGRHDTALVAHVMIGIGNKPFLRGFGPGLSPEKGVPMEYVDVGRWQWVCPEAGSPVTVTLWKNDETPAEGAPLSVPAGMTLEVHPQFPH